MKRYPPGILLAMLNVVVNQELVSCSFYLCVIAVPDTVLLWLLC